MNDSDWYTKAQRNSNPLLHASQTSIIISQTLVSKNNPHQDGAEKGMATEQSRHCEQGNEKMEVYFFVSQS